VNLYSLLVYIEHNGDESPKILERVKEDRNALRTINQRTVHWIGNILHRNCLLKNVTEAQIEGRIE
jgi:hypothetical protein